MKDFFPIETPYNSEEYKLMKAATNTEMDSELGSFIKSQFKKSPNWVNKFLWNIHTSELPVLYARLDSLYSKTGNDDYSSFLEDIKNVAGAPAEEVAEMLNPYDPMDANQTITGEPAGNSDLNADGIDTAPAYSQAPTMINKGIENFIDDDTIGQELAAEGDSDSLRNLHGMNAKPETLEEEWGDRYENVAFAQGEDALEPLAILRKSGPEAALKHLTQGHYPGEHDGSKEPNHGSSDKTFEKDGYILSWNPHLGYIGLQFDTQYNKQAAIAEDSQLKRHQVNQRGKIGDMPLGQHAPNSQAAKK